MKQVHIHLVSDATGETVHGVARACLVQFERVEAIEHLWPLIRTKAQLEKVIEGIRREPGFVMFTLVDAQLRRLLGDACREINVPCVPVLDSLIKTMAAFLGEESRNLPGRQHELDAEYFDRIEAMSYVLAHDDGQATADLKDADVILVGVSRTSKTPTSIYLANRGLRVANVPFVPGCPLPPELFEAKESLIVGLTTDAPRLVQIRRNRMHLLNQEAETDYTDLSAVKEEIGAARRLFAEQGWPVIDVSRRSIEETAAAIIQLFTERRRNLP